MKAVSSKRRWFLKPLDKRKLCLQSALKSNVINKKIIALLADLISILIATLYALRLSNVDSPLYLLDLLNLHLVGLSLDI